MDKAKFGTLIDKIEYLTQRWQWGKVGQADKVGSKVLVLFPSSLSRGKTCKNLEVFCNL